MVAKQAEFFQKASIVAVKFLQSELTEVGSAL